VIAHERTGEGDPIVVLNGFAGARADWDPAFLAALAAGHELVLVDNRGMGESGGGEDPFTVEDMAADTVELIESIGLDRPCLLGWSMGGFVAMAIALARPKLVGSLVLLATQSGAGQAHVPAAVAAKLRDVAGTPEEQARGLISVLFTPERAAEVESAALGVVAESRAALDPGVVGHQWEAMKGWNAEGATGRLGEIISPALVATGAEDVVCPPENASALAAGLSDAWLARFPRSGHAFMADRPEELAALISIFLKVRK
jgi:pimeloyl-ACP methyl ester carboxylesterase